MAAQFPRQLGGAGPLGDAPQRQHQFRRAAMGVVEDGVGEGIEDAAAIGALKIQDRSAVAAMHAQAVALAASRRAGIRPPGWSSSSRWA